MLTCVLLAVAGTSCVGSSQRNGEERQVEPLPIETVIERRTPELMSIPGVVGVGQALCDGRPCIRLYLSERTPEVERRIPAELDGYAVDTIVTGRIDAGPGGRTM
jgi:hypothetical protein